MVLQRAPIASPVGLILPQYVGAQRYGAGGQALLDRYGRPLRPLLYQEEIGGRPVTICNALEERDRIPVDELRDMAASVVQKRVTRGDAQKTADSARVLRDWWEDRRNSRWDRRNGRVSFSAATFAGSRAR